MSLKLGFGVFFVLATGCAYIYIKSLQSDLDELRINNNILINANESLALTNEKMEADFANGLASLANLKMAKEKELHYVTQIKTQIIRENNASCRDGVNNVFYRLWEQNANSQADRNGTAKN